MKKSSFSKVTLLGLLVFLLFSSNDCSHEGNVITGKVFPAGMMTPMRDVTVKVVGSNSTEVKTNGEGYFKVEVSAFPVDLEFTKKTYKAQVLTVKRPSDIVVYMTAGK